MARNVNTRSDWVPVRQPTWLMAQDAILASGRGLRMGSMKTIRWTHSSAVRLFSEGTTQCGPMMRQTKARASACP